MTHTTIGLSPTESTAFHEGVTEALQARDITLPLGYIEAVTVLRAVCFPLRPEAWMPLPYHEGTPTQRTVFHVAGMVMEQVRSDS